MNRPMCLTLVSMLTSVAAAVAAPEVEDPALRETVQLVVVAGALAPSAPVAPARVGKAAVVAPSCGPRCRGTLPAMASRRPEAGPRLCRGAAQLSHAPSGQQKTRPRPRFCLEGGDLTAGGCWPLAGPSGLA